MCAQQEAYEKACDYYEGTDSFADDFTEWLAAQEPADGQTLSVEDYRESSAYEDAALAIYEASLEPDYEEPDYDDYDSRAEEAYERSIDRARGYDC